MEVGDRLKKIREIYGLSQRELAKRVGLTNSTISSIERNSVSPSIASLKKILSGIPMTITEFFTVDLEDKKKVVYRADELIDMGSDGVEWKLVGRPDGPRALALLIETFAPGADTGTELMEHEGEEAGTVIEGKIEIVVGGESYLLNEGDSYTFPTNIPHRFRNRSNKRCRIVSAHTPPSL
ncbi:cupin domain-containing protein [Neptuniibacter halophilus]|uniref:cupin domain-containing protein n=1 Tax=Neptuniibacter halophilus TaxID=651666 RepID=UPI002573B47D|nr:cupin domain-containing protein [Neptuniibacter halophilus]